MSTVPTAAAPSASARSPTGGAGGADRLSPRRVFAFIAMCFGMFMAFLDIQLVSASLNEIQAGLSASGDEIPWVQTAY
ncbi:MAG TPA: MFS transporter, partial [Pseudolabrys sp.]